MTTGTAKATQSAWLDGVWVREARSVDGGPSLELSDVYWLQAGPWFADVRAPRPGRTVSHPLDLAQGFSGVVSTEGTTVTWTHDLDTQDRPPGHCDTGRTRFDHGVLVEWADGYEERWRPGAPEGAPAAVAEHRDPDSERVTARLVRVGVLAAAVWSGDRPGAALFADAGGWQPTLTVGSTEGIGAVRPALLADAAGGPLPPSWRRPTRRSEDRRR